jgi:hypothetical protein
MMVKVDTDREEAQTVAFARRRVLEEVRARLDAVSSALSDSKIEAGELHEDASELAALVQRIHWLADVSTPSRAGALTANSDRT